MLNIIIIIRCKLIWWGSLRVFPSHVWSFNQVWDWDQWLEVEIWITCGIIPLEDYKKLCHHSACDRNAMLAHQ